MLTESCPVFLEVFIKWYFSGYSAYNPITAAYFASQDCIYWFDEGQYLMRSKLDGSNKTRVSFNAAQNKMNAASNAAISQPQAYVTFESTLRLFHSASDYDYRCQAVMLPSIDLSISASMVGVRRSFGLGGGLDRPKTVLDFGVHGNRRKC